MTDRNNFDATWGHCPSGKISNFTARLNAKQRRSPVRWTYVATLAVLSGILAVRLGEASQVELQTGGVSCSEVLANIDGYIRGSIRGELESKMGFHLSNCPHCARQVRGLANKDVLGRLFGSGRVAQSGTAASLRSLKRNGCDDSAVYVPIPSRTPVVAQKVLAVVEE